MENQRVWCFFFGSESLNGDNGGEQTPRNEAFRGTHRFSEHNLQSG